MTAQQVDLLAPVEAAHHVLDYTWDIVESPAFQLCLRECLDTSFNQLQEHLFHKLAPAGVSAATATGSGSGAATASIAIDAGAGGGGAAVHPQLAFAGSSSVGKGTASGGDTSVVLVKVIVALHALEKWICGTGEGYGLEENR